MSFKHGIWATVNEHADDESVEEAMVTVETSRAEEELRIDRKRDGAVVDQVKALLLPATTDDTPTSVRDILPAVKSIPQKITEMQQSSITLDRIRTGKMRVLPRACG